MKVRKTLAVGIAAASISAGVAAPAQGEATTPQTAQVAQAARTEGTPSPPRRHSLTSHLDGSACCSHQASC